MLDFKCIICNSGNYNLINQGVRDDEGLNVVKCQYCQHIQLSPIPNYEEEIEFYNTDSQAKSLYKNIDVGRAKANSAWDTVRRKEFIKNYLI